MKDKCPTCQGEKDTRAKQCKACNNKYNHNRLNTGKDWHLHEKSGYITKCINGVDTYQHRYIVEQAIGRKLTTDETVHHKDEVKTNNDYDNLELMTKAEHHRLHSVDRDVMKQRGILGANKRWGKE